MNDLVTQEEGKDLTPVQKQKARTDALIGALEARQDTVSTLLTDSGIDPKVFLAVARRALQNNPDLLNCTSASLMKAFIDAATDGLPPDGRKAAMVIYKNKSGSKEAQYQPMYAGLLDIAYRSGNFRSIEARVVYEGDDFDYRLGDNPYISHKPGKRKAGMVPRMTNAYAIAVTTNGGIFREVFEEEDMRKVKAVSRATSGPGKDWPEEMARKGPLRRMWKFLPKDDRMARVAEHDNEAYDLDAVDVTPQRERRLAPGFTQAPPMQQVESESEPQHEDTTETVVQVEPVAEPEPVAESGGGLSKLTETVMAAKNWLSIKQGLSTLSKEPVWGKARVPALKIAWTRFSELVDAGEERTDILTDVLLFECWVEGTNPDPDTLNGNYRVIESSPAFKRLPEDEQKRLQDRVKVPNAD